MEEHKQHERGKSPGLHRNLQRIRDCFRFCDSVLFQVSVLCSESNLKTTGSEASVLSPSPFLQRGLLQGTWGRTECHHNPTESSTVCWWHFSTYPCPLSTRASCKFPDINHTWTGHDPGVPIRVGGYWWCVVVQCAELCSPKLGGSGFVFLTLQTLVS